MYDHVCQLLILNYFLVLFLKLRALLCKLIRTLVVNEHILPTKKHEQGGFQSILVFVSFQFCYEFFREAKVSHSHLPSRETEGILDEVLDVGWLSTTCGERH